MLKLTKVEILTDPDMYLFYEQGIRGGVSMISNRYAKANHKYMGSNYDPKKEFVHIQYMDANNLHGAATCEPLPIKDFRWLTEDEVEDLEFFAQRFVPFPQGVVCTLEVEKIPAMMKDEAGGNFITEFVGLRPKLYAFEIQNYDCMCDKKEFVMGNETKKRVLGMVERSVKGLKKLLLRRV